MTNAKTLQESNEHVTTSSRTNQTKEARSMLHWDILGLVILATPQGTRSLPDLQVTLPMI